MESTAAAGDPKLDGRATAGRLLRGPVVITSIHLSFLFTIAIFYIYVILMKKPKFIWDERKNKTNQQKHGVSFEEAQSVFYDENAFEFFDGEHSREEERFLLLGMSLKLRVLMIVHCYYEEAGIIRIISARKATKKEQREYFNP